MKLEFTNDIEKQDQKTLYEGLLRYNLCHLQEQCLPKDIGIYYRKHEQIKAGLVGETVGYWFTIKYLWVSEEFRGYL